MLTLDSLTVSYGGRPALSDFSVDFTPGTVHALIGPSGCGKSTLLKVLCGVHREYAGRVLYDGRDLERAGIRIGYVPQQYGLLEWKTVRRNIELPWDLGPAGRDRTGRDRAGREAAVREIAGAMGLRDVLDRYPRELSGGQRQRAALARALAPRPDLLLLDEPFSALDAFTAAACMELFLNVWRERRVTTLLITHNMYEAALLGERILVLGGGAGPRTGLHMQIRNEAFGKGEDGEDARAGVVKTLRKALREAVS